MREAAVEARSNRPLESMNAHLSHLDASLDGGEGHVAVAIVFMIVNNHDYVFKISLIENPTFGGARYKQIMKKHI